MTIFQLFELEPSHTQLVRVRLYVPLAFVHPVPVTPLTVAV